MEYHLRPTWCLYLLMIPFLGFGQHHSRATIETFINDHVQRYDLSQANFLRVSAYTELKGHPNAIGGIRLDFGYLGEMNFYTKNCLLRTTDDHVYHITLNEDFPAFNQALDAALTELFERIPLFSNGRADSAFVAFVDNNLSRKNLDPFHKIYARYLFLHYGQFDPLSQVAIVKSAWLNQEVDGFTRRDEYHGEVNPLTMRLDWQELKGFYHRTQGEAYVHDVDRSVAYATGETVAPNLTAFKFFLQKMMGLIPHNQDYRVATRKHGATLHLSEGSHSEGGTTIEALYHEYSWIPMMLGILRQRNISFGDPDIVRYFIDAPYFDRIYAQLTKKEKKDVDAYLMKMSKRGA